MVGMEEKFRSLDIRTTDFVLCHDLDENRQQIELDNVPQIDHVIVQVLAGVWTLLTGFCIACRKIYKF